MRRTPALITAVAMTATLAAAAPAAAPAAAAVPPARAGATITRPYDHQFAKYWRSEDFFQNEGTDTFTWKCLGVRDEPYYFTVYVQRTIVSPLKEVFSKDFTCDPRKTVTEKVRLDYGAHVIEFGKPPGPDGIHIKGTVTYPKQTDG